MEFVEDTGVLKGWLVDVGKQKGEQKYVQQMK